MKKILFPTILIFICFTTCLSIQEKFHVDNALNYCYKQTLQSLEMLKSINGGCIDYNKMPRCITSGQYSWKCVDVKDDWCAGFWPGILWYNYEYTKDSLLKKEAQKFTSSLRFLSKQKAYDHDLGFLIHCSYGNGYRLTKDPSYKQILLDTADSLATLFNPKVGTILSWPRNIKSYGGHNTIIDNMMNLELLLWASKNGGHAKLKQIAISHADTTMKYHFRNDYTSFHVVVYDSITGKCIKRLTHQGYSDDSMWSRGQAWAIYGYTMMFRETNDYKYLQFAKNILNAYIKRLPKDNIPYWDFNAPQTPQKPRDASAAAIVASALLDLYSFSGERKYYDIAYQTLVSLSSKEYQSRDKACSFLLHSTGHYPNGTEIDSSIIYADYYYIEALIKLKKIGVKI